MVFSLLLQHGKSLKILTILFLKRRTGAIPKRISFFSSYGDWLINVSPRMILFRVWESHYAPLAGAVPRELGSCFTAWWGRRDCLDAVPWVRSYLPQTSGAVFFRSILINNSYSNPYGAAAILTASFILWELWTARNKHRYEGRTQPRHFFQGAAPGSRVFAVTQIEVLSLCWKSNGSYLVCTFKLYS